MQRGQAFPGNRVIIPMPGWIELAVEGINASTNLDSSGKSAFGSQLGGKITRTRRFNTVGFIEQTIIGALRSYERNRVGTVATAGGLCRKQQFGTQLLI